MLLASSPLPCISRTIARYPSADSDDLARVAPHVQNLSLVTRVEQLAGATLSFLQARLHELGVRRSSPAASGDQETNHNRHDKACCVSGSLDHVFTSRRFAVLSLAQEYARVGVAGGSVGTATLFAIPGGPNIAACYGDGPDLHLMMRDGARWREIYSARGRVLILLPTCTAGVRDIADGGPGFSFPVWTWNGSRYTPAEREISDAELSSINATYLP